MEAYVLCLAQMSISFLFDGNIEKYIEFSNEFFDKNQDLKHNEMEMEMLLISGFIYDYIKETEISRQYYEKALEKSRELNNEYYKALCLCNIGIMDADNEINELFENIEYNNNYDANKNENNKSEHSNFNNEADLNDEFNDEYDN